MPTFCFSILSIVCAWFPAGPGADEILVGRLLDRISGGAAGPTGHQFAMETLRRLDASIVPQVNDRLERALTHPQVSADNLCEVLESYPDPRSVPVLVQCLQDPALRIRTRAIRLLGLIGDPAAVEPLLVYGRGAPDPQKQLVATAVVEIGGPEAERFVRGLLEEGDFDAAQHALAAYRLWKDESIIPVLVERLERDRRSPERIQHRIATAWTLGVLGSDVGRDELIAILEEPHPWARHQFVIAALGEIGGAEVERGLAGRIPEADEDQLIGLLHALATSGGDIARRELRLHASAEARRVRQEALTGLSKLGELEPAWEHWKQLREQPWSTDLRDWISFYTNRLHDERIVSDLLAWFEKADGARRESLLRILGHAGDSRAVPALVETLLVEVEKNGQRRSLADLATEALANCGPSTIEALQEAWGRASDEDQRRRILIALRNCGDRLGEEEETRELARATFDWVVEQFEESPEDRQIFLIESILPGFYDIRFGRWLWKNASSSKWSEPLRQSLEAAKRRFF